MENTGEYLEDVFANKINIMDSDIKIPHLGDAQVRKQLFRDSSQFNNVQLNAYQVIKFESPASWRLTSNDNTDSEVMFRLQGILCGFDLPPVTR